MKKKKVVVLTGAGISAESGIKTFRDAGGLWEGQDIMAVASPKGWARNRALVLEFYNQRRAQLQEVKPNPAHYALAELEKGYDVQIITQNVDDLHERAGSTNILHLHGELKKVRSTKDPRLIYEREGAVNIGDNCEQGSQLRPHIVWFGEDVPLIGQASKLAAAADVFIIVGTSMQVYPAAGLVDLVKFDAQKYFVDPHPAVVDVPNLRVIENNASTAVPKLVETLLKKA